MNDAIHSSAAAVSDDSHSISRIAANRLRLVPLSWKGETVELTLVRTLPTVFADRPYRIECEGAMLKRLAAVTIELNDDVVLCSSTSRDGLQFFAQPTDPNLFADVFGLARLSVSLRRPDALVPELFYAPPIHVLLPKGERAEAISKMAVRVASASDRLFPKENPRIYCSPSRRARTSSRRHRHTPERHRTRLAAAQVLDSFCTALLQYL